MPKKRIPKVPQSDKPFPPLNDIDRHLGWLFMACNLPHNNEGTNEFLIRLKQACENAFDNLEDGYKSGVYPKMVNTIPYISAELARLLNYHVKN